MSGWRFRNQTPLTTILLLLVLSVFCNRLQANNEGLYFGTLPGESGLSQMTVATIFQDSKGFLWFGTRDGLNRYDGYAFEVFRNDVADSSSISNNNISAIIEDGAGDLWIATENGLNCYHYSTNRFTRFYKSTGNEGISHNKVGSLHYDRNGRLWVGTEQGLDLYDPKTNTFTRSTLDGVLFNNRILSLLCDSYGNIWIGTLNSGLVRFNPGTGVYQVFRRNDRELHSLSGNTVRTIFEDSKRNLWIGTKTGLSLYNPKNSTFNHFGEDIFPGEKLSNDGVRCISEDREGNLLIGTNEGLNILNPETGDLRIYTALKNANGNLNHYYIYSILVDNAGTVWLGNFMGGINFYNKFNQQFRYSNPGNLGQLVYGGVGPMAESGKKLWIGTGGGGLFCYDETDGNYTRHQFDNSSFSSNVFKSLFISDNTIFIGTEESKLLVFDIHKQKVVKSFEIAGNPILNIYPASGGNLFLCVRDTLGIRLFNPGTGNSEVFSYRIPGNGRNMLFPFATCMLKENDSIYWIGTRYAGMYRYHANSKSAERFIHRADDPNSLSSNHVTSIYNDVRNKLWVGTGGNGICLFDPETDRFETFSEKDGLSNGIVLGILPDDAGFLWISTLTGISKLDIVNRNFKNYTFGNGFPIQEPAENSFLKLADGRLCFGGNNGFVTFNPEKIISNTFIPPLVITEFRLLHSDPKKDHRLQQRKFVPNNEEIRLTHNQSSFVISYTALSYIFPEKNQYAYQLEGFDDDWNHVGRQRIAIYTNLHAGDYRFKVKASNNDGVWNENYVTLNIRVMPPPWLAWYAYVFYFLLFAGFGLLMLHYIRLENSVSIKQIEQENLEKVHQLRIRMFTNFSHELRTPLTLIIGPLEDLLARADLGQSVRESLVMIRKNAHRLLLIVNQLMDFRKQESGNMQLKAAEGNFPDFLKEVTLAFSELAGKQQISYAFLTSRDYIPLWFDRLLLEKVFFNLLSNAFKNTPEGGKITVSVGVIKKTPGLRALVPSDYVADEYAEAVVADNGRGITEENQAKIFDPFYQVQEERQMSHADTGTGTGIGLSLSKGIVEQHSGVITVESNPGKGARFRVLLPMGNKHLRDFEIVHDFRDGEDSSHYLLSVNSEEPANPEAEVTSPDRHTVLIVEDNTDVRNFIRSHLRDTFNVLEAGDGESGFSLAVAGMPDLIISDVMMPGMDGLELCRKLKNDINTCHIPIILLTALTEISQIRQGFESGSDDYITKPFNPALLKMKVDSLIDNRERLRKVFSKKFPFEQVNACVSTCDELFLDKIYAILDKYISDSEFDLDAFSEEIGMSRANLYRKIKSLTNFAPNELIKNYRLKAAVKLLEDNKYSVSEVAYNVGFSTSAYFSNCFKKTYGISPSEYAEKNILQK